MNGAFPEQVAACSGMPLAIINSVMAMHTMHRSVRFGTLSNRRRAPRFNPGRRSGLVNGEAACSPCGGRQDGGCSIAVEWHHQLLLLDIEIWCPIRCKLDQPLVILAEIVR